MDPRMFNGNPLNFASSPTDAERSRELAPTQGPPPSAAGEPDARNQPVQGQQQESPEELQARLQAAEEARQRAEQEAAEARQNMQQITSGLQQFREQQQAAAEQEAIRREKAEIYQRARNMSPAEGFEYIQRETDRLDTRWEQRIQAIQQQAEQRMQQERQILGTPLYVDDLIKRHNLPPEYRDRLMRAGDPNVMARIAPDLAAEHQKYQSLQDQLNQMSRSQRADAFAQSGVGMVANGGAAGAPGNYSDDPDIRAMQILDQLQSGNYQPT